MEKASFKLDRYVIPEFSFNLKEYDISKVSMGLDPSGIYQKTDNKYILTLMFIAFTSTEQKESTFVKCQLEAEFSFSKEVMNLEDIPHYFYVNSIAIVFPYLRAFISSITIQANANPLILPTMNLSSLGSKLIENTSVK